MTYDVVVVGYGPTGMVLSALLGRRGHRVAVVERYAGLFNLPRAATFDDDTMRVFQRLGIAEEVAAGTRVQRTYDWCNAAGQILIRNHFSDVGRSGWPEFNMMFQPVLERELDALCRRTPSVDIFLEHQLVDFDETDDLVHAFVRAEDGQVRTLSARYLIGSDGGNSTVRAQLGVDLDDYGFQEPWLVCDFALKRDIDLPMAQQFGDPEQPTSIISIGPNHHRFSFMLDGSVPAFDEVADDDVWRRVSRWISPDDADLIRVAPYTFRSTVAQTWRRGRVLLAGDAAHQMPPFLGQGMCSGIRDSHNLAWKLDLILRGADDNLLDTYAVERSSQVRAITEKAVELGRIQTVRDKEAARLRDEQLLRNAANGDQTQGFRFPGYPAGFLAPDGPSDTARGDLLPQGRVARSGNVAELFDDVSGGGWVLLLRNASMFAALGEERDMWRSVEGVVVSLGSPDGTEADGVVTVADVDLLYTRWLDEHDCDAVLVRPDWYVFGSADTADALRRLMRSLSRYTRRSLTGSTGALASTA
jgi:2-polyprenyl-6-methoxyphenol hydroxylase-like FAD-dependent oxidoreductase